MTLFLQCYLELEMFLLGSLTYNLVLVVSLKTHPPHQVFPRTLPLFLASSSLEPSPPLSPGNFSWDHPIYRRGYNNIELHKGDGPSLYFSLPGKLLIYAKCPLSPQQTSSVHWDNWERQAFSKNILFLPPGQRLPFSLYLHNAGGRPRWFFSKQRHTPRWPVFSIWKVGSGNLWIWQLFLTRIF